MCWWIKKREVIVVDVPLLSDGNITKKEHEKLEKYQGLKEKLEKTLKVKIIVVPVVIRVLGAVTPKLEK